MPLCSDDNDVKGDRVRLFSLLGIALLSPIISFSQISKYLCLISLNKVLHKELSKDFERWIQFLKGNMI